MEINITWNICRVCLVEEEKKPQVAAVVIEPMRHIFNDDEMLANEIYKCSGVTMRPNDNLPEKICKKCYALIKYAVNFRETCRASDTYLQNILQRTNSASALFKNQQPPALDSLEEIISNDCLSIDINESDDEISNNSKRKETHVLKSSKIFKDSAFSDLMDLKNVDFINEKNSIGDNTLDHNASCIKEAIASLDKHNDDSEIILQLNTSHNGDTDENQESESEGFKENNDDAVLANNEQKGHDNIEDFEQLEELTTYKVKNHLDLSSDMESESRDSHARVSSTVAVKEDGFEIMQFEAEDTKLSSESNDMQTEYIIDGYLIDDNSRDSISSPNSSVLLVHSKKARSAVYKCQAHKSNTKTSIDITTPSKAEKDLRLWVCDMCGNHFSNRQILNAHIRVHRQEKNHECEICSKRFLTACNLQAHMRIHTGEKPFECKYCGRRFNDRSSNLRHERTHTNERPFECKQCGKAFSLGATLKKHQKVHTGERSFRCDICDKSFKLPHQLKAHKNSTLHKAAEQLTQINE